MAEGESFKQWRDSKQEGEEEKEAKQDEAAAAGTGDDDDDDAQQGEESGESTSQMLLRLLKQSLGLTKPDDKLQLLETLDLDGIAKYINSGKVKNIITMAGAGISTSAGIPDFRSPTTGLYANLHKYNLPNPTAIFEIDYFRENPDPFFSLAKELWPGNIQPTVCHYFIKMLKDKGLLKRHYTQNIDTLERVAGLEDNDLVEAHGSFHIGHCIDCQQEYSQDWIKENIFADKTPRCTRENCNSVVKPDVIFFGEALPKTFFSKMQTDFPKCDLLIVMGTSLVVQPFASLVQRVHPVCPRLYVNDDKATWFGDSMLSMFGLGHGFNFDSPDNFRDVFWGGTCDDGCLELAKKLGWADELMALVKSEQARIEAEYASQDASQSKIPGTSSLQKEVAAGTLTERAKTALASGEPLASTSPSSKDKPNKL